MTEFYTHQRELSLVPPSHEVLNQIAEPIAVGDIGTAAVQGLIDSMLAIAQGEQGNPTKPTMVGLAAPQIGMAKRIVILGTNAQGQGEKPHFLALINPVITKRSQTTNMNREGCYSTGRVCGVVERSTWVQVQAFDRLGRTIEATYDDFVARVLQHEVDHLDGIRFPDRIPPERPLLWVEPEQFGDFRTQWDRWPVTCERSRWEAIKTGVEA